MNSIEILVEGLGSNIEVFIDVKNIEMVFNGKKKYINNDNIDELVRIIRTWKCDYGSNSGSLDAEAFYIKVNMDNGFELIKGKGNYPENYMYFKAWLGSFYD